MEHGPLYLATLKRYAAAFHAYGDREYFRKALEEGFKGVCFGNGPWVNKQRVDGIFAISGGGWVRVIEMFQRKTRGNLEVITGKQMNSCRADKFPRHVRKFQITLGYTVGLGELIREITYSCSPEIVQSASLELKAGKQPEQPEPKPTMIYVPPQIRRQVFQQGDGYGLYVGRKDDLGLISHDSI